MVYRDAFLFGVSCHQYADNTQLSLSIPTESGDATEVLDKCLEVAMGERKAKKRKEKETESTQNESIMCSGFMSPESDDTACL